jgi:hypothetical protein
MSAKLMSRKALAAAAIGLIIVGVIFLVGGAAVYLQRTSKSSQLPMPPGLPANPDATIGIVCMVMGAVIIASGISMQLLG